MNSKKGYKVTDVSRSRICGVACSSLPELKDKGCIKLSIPPRMASRAVVLLQDGTEIDDEDYFQTIPQQTLFILQRPGEVAVTGHELLLDMLKKVNSDYLNCGRDARSFMDDEKVIAKMQEILMQMDPARRKRLMSSRAEDPEWFEGLDTSASTKEQFLSRRAQDRIRGYLNKTREDLKRYSVNSSSRKKLETVIESFQTQLKEVKYFGDYFDRHISMEGSRICNKEGTFLCEGRWDHARCSYQINGRKHEINPYDNKEARVVFSTWNLDHRIERTRSIIPAMVQAATDADDRNINWKYFYSLMFTRTNLKMVHIVCHDKGAHGGQDCNPAMYYARH